MVTETVELLPGDSKTYSVTGNMKVVLFVVKDDTLYIQAQVGQRNDPNLSAKYTSTGEPLYLGAGIFKLWNSKGSDSSVTYSIVIGEV